MASRWPFHMFMNPEAGGQKHARIPYYNLLPKHQSRRYLSTTMQYNRGCSNELTPLLKVVAFGVLTFKAEWGRPKPWLLICGSWLAQ